MAETDLEMAERHVTQGAENIARQRDLIAELERDGHAELASEARRLLGQFEELQAEHVAHRDRLLSGNRGT